MDEAIMAQEMETQIAALSRQFLAAQQEAAALRNQKDRLAAQITKLEGVIENLHDENTKLKAELYEYITACGGLLDV